jgi:hypothetical protein
MIPPLTGNAARNRRAYQINLASRARKLFFRIVYHLLNFQKYMKFHNIEKNGLCVYEKISKSTELARFTAHRCA